MKEIPSEGKFERVPLDVLLRQARDRTRERSESSEEANRRRAVETGRGIKSCSVYGFYEPFLVERGADEEEMRETQNWISDCINVLLGERDIRTLSMEGLADLIAEALNQKDPAEDDRWALYELCFMLTAQMCILKEDYFGRRAQTVRCGTPDEEEPRSLYRRVCDMRTARKALGAATAKFSRVSLAELLQSVNGKEHMLREDIRNDLPKLKIAPVMYCLLQSKYGLDGDEEDRSLQLYEITNRLEEMYRMCTGEEWNDESSISDLAVMMTWRFSLDTECKSISRESVMQAYELCYEFISLFASEAYEEGHVSLMETENKERGRTNGR